MDPPRPLAPFSSGRFPLLAPRLVRAALPAASRLGVSAVARSERGFARWYVNQRRTEQDEAPAAAAAETEWWLRRRHGFLARHTRQMQLNGEALWQRSGVPTRRHVALIVWAYSPDPVGVRRWLGL